MSAVYSLTLFLSACLLFIIQPMVGKMLLPTLGGSAAVWNVCMVFFQALLLGGYLYGHLSMRWLSPLRQATLHCLLLLTPVFVLPVALSPELLRSVPQGDPTLWLLGGLLVMAGLPYFVVSATSPVFQRWFSWTDHKDAQNPYFLYAASNAGSITGLFLYPLVIERKLTIAAQSTLWTMGYVLFVVCSGAAAFLLWRSRRRIEKFQAGMGSVGAAARRYLEAEKQVEPLTWGRRGLWVLLAAIPSSLMLGFTTYITTDIASVPLLWVIPLGLYLLSFIFVFARRPLYAPWWVGRGMGLVAVVIVVAFLVEVTQPAGLVFGLHLGVYFAAVMVAHSRLARDRPPPAQLTEFFLLMSLGGVLGGIFNGLLAPLIFNHIYEYLIAIALACAFREIGPGEGGPMKWWRALMMVALTALSMAVVVVVLGRMDVGAEPGIAIAFFGVPAVLACTQISRPKVFGLAMGALIAVGSLYTGYYGAPIYFERNFYGTVRVADDPAGAYRQLVDGNTVHGRQRLGDESCAPLSYYHPTGPAGRFFDDYHRRRSRDGRAYVGVIGMGIGSLACFGRSNEHWDLFELNPLVVDVATDPEYFTLLDQATMDSQMILTGDGRLRLQDMNDDRYDVLVIDAFSSGSIPVHLITREAFMLYTEKLKADGVLLIHISNRLFNLAGTIGNLATALDLEGVIYTDSYVSEGEERAGKDPSIWAILSPDEQAIATFLESSNPAIAPIRPDPSTPVWTDSYSDIIAPLLAAPSL